jgi:hypothetical protein
VIEKIKDYKKTTSSVVLFFFDIGRASCRINAGHKFPATEPDEIE